VTLADAQVPLNATWASDDAIYFNEAEGTSVRRVASAGGPASAFFTPPTSGPGRLAISQVLPDARTLLATRWVRSISAEYSDVLTIRVGDGTSTVVVQSGYDARFVPPGLR